MRVCEISHTVPPEVFIRRHAEALRGSPGLELVLVGRSPARGEPAASIADGAPRPGELLMPNFDHLSLPAKVWNLRYALRTDSWRLRRPLRDRAVLGFFDRLQPDLIHFHMAGLAVLMRWIAEALGIPYTVSLRGSDVQVEPLMCAQYAEALREVIEGAAAVHTVCNEIQQSARDLGVQSERMRTIYTTVPIPADLPELAAVNQDLRFLAAGRLHWRKDFPLLVKAFRILLDMGIKAELTLVGAGPDRDRICHWINELELGRHVRLVGKLSPAEINLSLRRAHGFVQSSVAEGLSNSLAEAMAAGCPVFATNVGGTSEIVRDKVSGFLLPWIEPESWPDRLLLAGEAELMRQVRERAWSTAKSVFAAELHVQQFSVFYAQAAARGRVPTARKVVDGSLRRATARESLPLLSDGGVLICATWEWPNQLDEILLALARHSVRTRVVLAGLGPQEAEIRYLVRKLQLDNIVHLIKAPPAEVRMRLRPHTPQFERPVFLEATTRPGFWRVSGGGHDAEVPFEGVVALLRGGCKP